MIVIAGATGVGKTDFALSLAEYFPIEIVNADLGQFYQPLTIGTAKPSWQHQPVQHHLFDIFSKPRTCTVMEYRTLLLECLQKIWEQNKIPVIVGGSTFYVESIFFEPAQTTDSETLSFDPELNNRETLELWNELNKLDPERASKIHPHDRYRIKRGLAIWYSTGIKPSQQKPIYNPPAHYWFFYLTRDRSDLYNRINARVVQMLNAGWIDEVKSLMNTEWETFIKTKKFIGYPELMQFLSNPSISKQEVIDLIAKKTRNYAKRQETYWKRLEKKLHNCLVKSTEYTNKQMSKVMGLNLTTVNIPVYIKQLSEQLIDKNESSSL